MNNEVPFLLQYVKKILKNWFLWLFLILDVIGFLIAYFFPHLQIPTLVLDILAFVGLFWAGFKVYRELENENPIERYSINDLVKLMPDLIQEMKIDFPKPENIFVREFLLLRKGWVLNSDKTQLVYYYDDHPNLQDQIVVLENRGYIFENSISNVKKYRISEDFFSFLTK